MYSLGMPVTKIRTKVRQEFEKHRYVNHLSAVDVLLTQSHMEFQVRQALREAQRKLIRGCQETLNYWKQLSHVMKYFRPEEDPNARLPSNFISGFLEVSPQSLKNPSTSLTIARAGINVFVGAASIIVHSPLRARAPEMHQSILHKVMPLSSVSGFKCVPCLDELLFDHLASIGQIVQPLR